MATYKIWTGNLSSIIIEGIKAFSFFFKRKKIGTNKLIKASSYIYIHTFTDLLSPIFFRLKKIKQ